MGMVNLSIDGRKVTVEEETTILEAAEKAGVRIPTLCYLKELGGPSACRICLVDVKGAKGWLPSCSTLVQEGMEVLTHTPELIEARKVILELILSNHPMECLTCGKNGNCELQDLAKEFNIREIEYTGIMQDVEIDDTSPSIIRDPRKCILCRRCVTVCSEVQKVGVLSPSKRGFDTVIAPPFDLKIADSPCTNCGQCSLVCPTGAIMERDETDNVWEAIRDPKKFTIVQTAPAIRVSLGEPFGLPPGSIVVGQMVAALRRLGFDRVFDTDFAADLTIMEEGTELLERIEHGGKLPLITSCSPGWIKFCEHFYPDFLDDLSTCKSPQQMFGAVAKTYYAEKLGIDPKDMFVVSIMPCTAKKFEAGRPEMNSSGVKDIDVALTTREVARMIKEMGIDIANLPAEDYDDPLGISTGAGAIFGATGGVMEAALRTAYEVYTGIELEELDFHSVRGMQGIKETEVVMKGLPVRVAVAHGLANARELLDEVRSGKKEYHFIEIMCCPGGCIGGGGQPIPTDREIRKQRIKAIYEVDKDMPLRKSHENPAVKTLYAEFLGKPLSEKSHQLLHTHYISRGIYKV
ncbi:MAG: NADH-dependent [FeFe] hydrogenase, group A6 [Clostridiales bacterium]|nr:NADH-dependent [FeFe] hydrogenase, group A6 [Clostridiales bacterium]